MAVLTIGDSLVEKYLEPPVVKFRLLVGYPERPLDFREINVAMVGVPEYLKFRDEYGRYMLPPGLLEYLFGPKKD